MSYLSDRVDSILERYWDRKLPVNIEQIANNMGISVCAINPFNSNEHSLSGMALIDSNGTRVAKVNTSEAPRRQRFTLAHEIAHHELGHVSPAVPCQRDGTNVSNYNSVIEVEANEFAAQLLMPESVINDLIYTLGISDIDQLANTLSVSSEAMYWRLKHLDII